MQKTMRLTLMAMTVLGLSLVAVAQQDEPLADAARKARADNAQKPQSKRTWTNDDIKSTPEAPAASADPKAANATDKPADAAKADDKSAVADKGKKDAEWKAKIEEQQKAVAQLEREASLNEREWKLRQAAFYGDAGTQLRDQKRFADEEQKHAKDADSLRAAIDVAKKKLDEIQEQARKDGSHQ